MVDAGIGLGLRYPADGADGADGTDGTVDVSECVGECGV